jgi:urea transporter/murein DD-endopeptidase MepM/ murein hydrolase activator NlpD
MEMLRKQAGLYLEGFINSYSQIFFSNNRALALLLLLVSFFDAGAGLGGVMAILMCQLLAALFKYNPAQIRDGTLTFNALMVGVAIGIMYQWNISILALIGVASSLTFFITVWYLAMMGAKRLPILSYPFLLSIWVVILGAGKFSLLRLSPKTSLSLFTLFPELFEQTNELVGSFPAPNYFHLLFRSTGAIFFQFNDLAGIIILAGIFLTSRIAFMLAIYSFSIGFLFYQGLEGDFSQLIYSYIGFNFIMTGIALGGFFIVPSWRSFLLVGLVIPVNALLISALHTAFQVIGLPLFSLPFNIVVLLTLTILGQRYFSGGLVPVYYQEYSPEKHIYKYRRSMNRFGNQAAIHISLPVLGDWHISQGFSGRHTHKEAYRFAWDFDVRDESGMTFRLPGTSAEDYYCYGLPVMAPAAGYVSDVMDGIADNAVTDVNLLQNWGNSIVIRHADGLYSKLSHLQPGSIQVRSGDFVYKGQVIARCGSSGRSPEPHLHFQLQATPYIGSATLRYPIAYYLVKGQNGYVLRSFDYPMEGETLRNYSANRMLLSAFALIPGKAIRAEAERGKSRKAETWKVYTNAYNQAYIFSEETGACAYFINDGSIFYFTDYFGSKRALLFQFYQAAYKVLLGYYQGAEITDQMIPTDYLPYPLSILHDFAAPFVQPVKAQYTFSYVKADQEHQPTEVQALAVVKVQPGKYEKRYQLLIKESGVQEIICEAGKKNQWVIRCSEA